MPNLFTWLHLSDIHARHGDRDYRAAQAQVLRDLIASLRRPPPEVGRVDAIFVTGDLGFSGGAVDPGEYDDVAAVLAAAASALHVPADRVFPVAGNHDVDRGAVAADPAIAAWLDQARRGDASLADPSAIRGRASAARFARWRDLVARTAPHLVPHLADDGAWSFDLAGATGAPIRLVGLNTALLAQDDADRQRLRIGWRQADPVFSADRIVLMLGHHPLSWLADPVDLLGPVRRWVDVYLHGHIHEQGSHALLDGGGDLHVTAVAGATHLDEREHVGSRSPIATGRGRPLQHAYGFGTIAGDSGGPLMLRFWPRAYDPSRGFIVDARNCRPGVDHAELPVPKQLSWITPPAAAPALPASAPRIPTATPPVPSPPPAPVERAGARGSRPYRPPLEVYVAWRPGGPETAEFATHLYGLLHRSVDDPFSYADLDIPLFFRSAPARGSDRPIPIDFDRAEATAVVALLDEASAGESAAPFRQYVRDLASECDRRGGRTRVIPVALHPKALKIPGLDPVHFVRADERTGRDRIDAVTNGVVHHLSRLLRVAADARPDAAPPPPIDVFLSHTKRDQRPDETTSEGEEIAERVRAFLHHGTGASTFLDRHEIAPGWKFITQLDQRISDPRVVFLAVVTDAFARSEWCREEIATARRERRPIVAIDARKGPQHQNLPFLGHAPVFRWLPDDVAFWRELLRTILVEALRYAAVPPYLASIERLWLATSDGSLHVPRRPDPTDLVDNVHRLLHPDPPLMPAEADLFHRAAADLTLATPSTLPLKVR